MNESIVNSNIRIDKISAPIDYDSTSKKFQEQEEK